MSVNFSTWPDGLKQIELRDPELGDSLGLAVSVEILTAMDGSTRAYKKTPARRAREMVFTNLSLTEAAKLVDFLVATQGFKLRFIDWEDKNWTGFILTDPSEIAANGRGLGNEPRPERLDVQLTFEGKRL